MNFGKLARPPSGLQGKFRYRLWTLTGGLLCVASWSLLMAADKPATSKSVAEDPWKAPAGLPPVECPEDNPMNADRVALGKQLFFDRRLSSDKTVSCADCHDPKKGYSNGEQFATGVGGQKGGRSAPTIVNSAYQQFQFWDGRAGTLEEQALGPIENPIEMNLPLADLVKRLKGITGYRERFQEVFGREINTKDIAMALASYERTILSGDAPYDRYQAGDKTALSESAARGLKLFFGKAHCSACHPGPNFTDNAFHNIGVGMDKKDPDVGRFAISKLGGDRGSFKTPTLREIARTAPYMHDGSQKTLEDVVDHYNKGGVANDQLDEEIYELHLTPQEKADLVQFLKEGLSSDSYPIHEAPELPQ